KGTLAYPNLLAAVQGDQELAAAAGYRPVVACVTIVHGESVSYRKDYYAGILQWQSDLETDIQAITGQEAPIPAICSQASVFGQVAPDRQLFGAGGIGGTAMGRSIWGGYSTYNACKSRTTHHMGGVYY